MLYMELRGIPYDSAKAAERLTYVNSWIYRRQAELDRISGFGVKSLDNLWTQITDVICYVKDPFGCVTTSLYCTAVLALP